MIVQGYKLRLGDGTTFALDEKGLLTWLQGGLVDDKARVQPAGSNEWLSIRQLMVLARAVAERTAGERAVAERAAAKERAAEERRAAEEQAAAEARGAADRQAEQERLEAERQAAEKRAEAERRAAEECAARERMAEQQRLEAERQAAEERADAERRAAERRAEAERRADAERRAEERRAEAERRAAEERAAAEEWAARERQAERQAAAERAEAEHRAAERRAEAERLAADEQAAAEERPARARAALKAEAAFDPPQTEIELEPLATDIPDEPLELEAELHLVPLEWPDSTGPARANTPSVGRPHRAPVDERAHPSPQPLYDEEPARERVSVRALFDAAAIAVWRELTPVLEAAEEWLRRSVEWLRRVATARRGRVITVWREVTSRVTEIVRQTMAGAVQFSVQFKAAARASWTSSASPSEATPVSEEPAPPPASVPSTLKDAAGTLAVPPPSFRDLPVIPLADMGQPTNAADEQDPALVLDGRAAELVATLWVWFKRVTVAAALLLSAALLTSSSEVWLPRVRAAAIALFSEIHELRTRMAPKTVPPAAVQASSEQLPQLRPQTIELIMASSGEGALDPVEVFRRAYDAVERARPALGQTAVAELDGLTSALMAELPPAERARLSDYLERVRARAVTAPYEDKEAVWLMARAARRLPAEQLSRLQELFANAVAAGLQPRASAPGYGLPSPAGAAASE